MNELEKKTERIEIRVRHSKKQAFNTACENSGDTPSSALRRFIDGYIKRADQDAFADGIRAMGRMTRRRWLPISAGVTALLLGGIFAFQALQPAPQDGPIVTASTEDFPPIDYTLFAAYDKNANGVLDLGEVAENDEHLHRVLNLDGEAGIAPSEFYTKAKMRWQYVEKNSVKTDVDGAGLPTARIIKPRDTKIVEFDLTDSNFPKIQVRDPIKKVLDEPPNLDLNPPLRAKLLSKMGDAKVTVKRSELTDRSVSWERGKKSPKLSFSNYDFRLRAISQENSFDHPL